jgi:hypothetical protein
VSALAASVRDCGGHLTFADGEHGGPKIIWPKVPGCRCLVPHRERAERAYALVDRIEALDHIGRKVVLARLVHGLDDEGLSAIEGTIARAEERR